MKTARYIAEARAKVIPVDETLKKFMKRQLTRLCNKSVGLINGQGNNWGGIAAVLESYMKENILNFRQHSMYLLGIDCQTEDDSLVQEGNSIFPVITTNLAQQTKTIAYGVISHEHHKVKRFIFSSIKSALEEVIRYRKTIDIPI